MSVLYGVPLDAAYHLVSALTGAFAPVLGGLATVAGIVVFTLAVRLLIMPLSYRAMRGQAAQARLAPQMQALRQRYRTQPERWQREVASLYRREGTSMFAGYLPLLAQWPFLSVVYLLFRSPRVSGHVNGLLTHDLFGVPLGMHWLAGAGPVSVQGAVFGGLFAALAGIGWLSARLARQASLPALLAPGGRPPADPPDGGVARPSIPPRPARSAAPASPAPASSVPGGAWLTRLLPLVTVAFAAFSPLAAGIYLATTTGWTVVERRLLRSKLAPPKAPTPVDDRDQSKRGDAAGGGRRQVPPPRHRPRSQRAVQQPHPGS
jgi:YidC/Oxa1 family membrane protein insertase